ncbi:MAG: GTP pyrophosphokinase family protein, partial [Ignavibacteriota bacterium]
PKSIMDKLRRRGLDVTVESAKQNLTDIAGIRVICPYVEDIYLICNMLTLQDDIELIRTNDYIKNPKPNGYRSLHLIVSVPVFLSDRKELVKAEVQIRTIAMDFWASLEHEIAYKLPESRSETIREELKDCADVINNTDKRMQSLYNILATYKISD